MSGRKRIYVDEGEWNRLQQQSANLAMVQRDVPKLLRDIRDQTQRDIERSTADFEARQARTDQALSGLSEQTRTLEANTARRLREVSRRMHSELASTADELRTDLRKQSEALSRDLADERRERQRAFNQLQSEITGLKDDQVRASAAAATALSDARALSQAVAEMPHQRYAPAHALERLEDRLTTAEQHLADGRGAYVLASATELVHALSDLSLDIRERDLSWRQQRMAAERALVVIEAVIQQDRKITANTDEAGRTIDIDVDHWSRGALSRLEHEVRTRLAAVRDDDRPMTETELRETIELLAPRYDERREKIVAQAGTAVFASQLRANFAELILEVLNDTHYYELEDATYAGDDQRNGFYARSRHISGSEIVVQVEPTADDSPACELRVLSYDVDAESVETRKARSASIQQSLEANGLAVSGVQDEGGEPDPVLKDLTAIRQGRPNAPAEHHGA